MPLRLYIRVRPRAINVQIIVLTLRSGDEKPSQAGGTNQDTNQGEEVPEKVTVPDEQDKVSNAGGDEQSALRSRADRPGTPAPNSSGGGAGYFDDVNSQVRVPDDDGGVTVTGTQGDPDVSSSA